MSLTADLASVRKIWQTRETIRKVGTKICLKHRHSPEPVWRSVNFQSVGLNFLQNRLIDTVVLFNSDKLLQQCGEEGTDLKMTLSIYQSIYVQTLTCGPELWLKDWDMSGWSEFPLGSGHLLVDVLGIGGARGHYWAVEKVNWCHFKMDSWIK